MPSSPYLISAQALFEQIAQPNLVIIDTRFSLSEPHLGRSQYEAAHIPGAYYLDLNQDLSSPVQSHGGRHPLPSWSDFTHRLNALGITSNPPTRVVVYDDSRFAFAARVWWMLRYLGHEQVSILDGGWQAWKAAGLPLSQEIPKAQEGNFIAQMQQNWTVDIEAVRQRSRDVVLIDSRSPERYKGEIEPIDPIAGTIPGAINAFWQAITTEAGFLKEPDALSKYWSDQGITPADNVTVFCGSGVTACVNLFSLAIAGHPMHKLYPGGWSDWCSYIAKNAKNNTSSL